jgi:lantibiotic modifying enzyme
MAALMQLYEFLGEEEYLNAAYEAARYENSYFSPEDENWLDLRRHNGGTPYPENRPRCANFWCHGAPGIGQSRLEAYRITRDEMFLDDLRRAVRTCMALTDPAVPNNGYSLCHGILGNYELALNACEILPELGLAAKVQAICQHIIDDFIARRIPIPNGIGNSYEIPCFMTGLSGVGYFLLRAYDYEMFPSVLLLQPK